MRSEKLSYFHPAYGLVRVKRGFSWPAFLLGSLWALAKRMHMRFLGMLVLEAVLWFVTGYAEGQGSAGLTLVGLAGVLAYAFVRGKYGNRWVESHLRAKGYTTAVPGGFSF